MARCVAWLGGVAALFLLSPVPVAADAPAPWVAVPSPNGTTGQNNLAAIACAPGGDCWAVGQYDGGAGAYHNLVLHGAGDAWLLEDSPNTSDTLSNGLNGVTCSSDHECWAVGYSYTGVNNTFQTLIEHRTASGWSIVANPNPPALWSFLYGVACPSATQCWAVGWSWNGAIYQTLVEQYTGGIWSIVSSPNALGTQSQLVGVACVNVSDCWAVGSYLPPANQLSGSLATLVEHYDGTGWSIAPSSNPGSGSTGLQTNSLNGVACASTGECWAAGWYANNSSGLSLIETNTGSGWTVQNSPNQPSPGSNDQLAGITCVDAGECYAVGSYYDRVDHRYKTLVEQWDGSAWSIASSDNIPGSDATTLLGASCVSSRQCRAAGVFYANCTGSPCAPPTRTLIEASGGAPTVAVPEWPGGPATGIGVAVAGLMVARRRPRLLLRWPVR